MWCFKNLYKEMLMVKCLTVSVTTKLIKKLRQKVIIFDSQDAIGEF